MRPEPHLEGPRVLLRLGRPEDIPAIIRYFDENASHLAPFEPRRAADFLSPETWARNLSERQRLFAEDRGCHLFVFRPGEQRVIGAVNLQNFVRGALQACHLGYSIAAAEQGKGLMHEALVHALAYAFGELDMHRVMASHLPTNRRSAQLLARLGFVAEGYARRYLRIDGEWRDHVLTAITAEEWHARQN